MLFRKEVLEAKRASWLGSISLSQPISSWVLAVFSAIAALTVILFLFFGSYTRRTPVSGQLVPVQGLSAVAAPATGVVAQVHVAEGDTVQAGQPLVTLQMPRSLENAVDAHAALAAQLESRRNQTEQARQAQSELLDARRIGVESQLQAARAELAQIRLEVVTRQQQVALARQTLERLQALRVDKYVSELQLKQQEAAVLEYTSEAQILQRQVISSQRLISQLQQTLAELPAQQQSTQAEYGRDVAVLEQERLESKARNQLVVTAAVGGVISAQMFKAGQSVQAGQVLSHILPGDGLLEAELMAPSSAIGFISIGDSVRIRYHAYPYQKFGHQEGLVKAISRSGFELENQGPTYRILVSLKSNNIDVYGRGEGLRPGMMLDVDILGERKRLIEWALDPINSIGKMGV